MRWLRFHAWPIGVHMLVWSLLPLVVCACALPIGRSTYDHVQATAGVLATLLFSSLVALVIARKIAASVGAFADAASACADAIARRVDGAQTAREMVDALIDLAAGPSTPASVTLADDLTVVALRAAQAQSAVDWAVGARDGRVLVAPGGSRGRW
jgi:hypothetical protein